MSNIRKARKKDIARIAEILIFSKRISYRSIFQNDHVSFNQMQVVSLAKSYYDNLSKLNSMWVYDDGIVKGLLHVADREIKELYVEPFFQHQGIGAHLLYYATVKQQANYLWVLEKNSQAIAFYQKYGFVLSEERMIEENSEEYLVKMVRKQWR